MNKWTNIRTYGEINEKPKNSHLKEEWMNQSSKKWTSRWINTQLNDTLSLRPTPGIQLEGEEEEPEEEATLGSRLMSLLEKVRLVKKKEEKPEEEPPAEESKPREDWEL